jgi:hypothetical protein
LSALLARRSPYASSMLRPSLPGADDSAPQDADLKFERLVREPRIAITLMTAVIVTAIIWITTFIATVSSAAAYLVQVTATPAADEPFQPLAAAPSFPPMALATSASHRRDFPPDEVVQTTAGTEQSPAIEAARIAPPLMKVSPQALVPVSGPAPQNVEVRTETATVPPMRLAQDQSAGAEQASTSETGATGDVAGNRCADGFWGGLCRERMRWNTCHPDKWDVTPECAVQKFNSYNLQ